MFMLLMFDWLLLPGCADVMPEFGPVLFTDPRTWLNFVFGLRN